mmetsp:Transcript_25997/g.41753  ORF Transcript_25997/g.41753 Transcript_25997/m.41753 type:complete len:288 (-) Transcript_25997:905-1768(-)
MMNQILRQPRKKRLTSTLLNREPPKHPKKAKKASAAAIGEEHAKVIAAKARAATKKARAATKARTVKTKKTPPEVEHAPKAAATTMAQEPVHGGGSFDFSLLAIPKTLTPREQLRWLFHPFPGETGALPSGLWVSSKPLLLEGIDKQDGHAQLGELSFLDEFFPPAFKRRFAPFTTVREYSMEAFNVMELEATGGVTKVFCVFFSHTVYTSLTHTSSKGVDLSIPATQVHEHGVAGAHASSLASSLASSDMLSPDHPDNIQKCKAFRGLFQRYMEKFKHTVGRITFY